MAPPASPPADAGGNLEHSGQGHIVLYADRHLRVTWSPPDTSVTLSGEVDVSNSAELASALTRVPDSDHAIVVDAADLRFIDLSGLRVLLDPSLGHGNSATGYGRAVRLRNMPPHLERLLRLLGGGHDRL
ncbi:STAS domain-containing protein [Sphaerimonospora sp. CA-214678]|uniref:STAS domain-containing protein n=1 Tax=Sphaerimonospora sp. CA-214678 TaxID=3240029 RepID=UPI003D8CFF22